MAIAPNDAASMAQDVRAMYVRAEERILGRLAKALAKSSDAPDWLTVKLAQQRAMIDDLDSILTDLVDEVPGAVDRVTDLAYNRGVKQGTADGVEVGIAQSLTGATAGAGPQVALARAATEPLVNMRMQIRRWTYDTYAKVGLLAAEQVAAGDTTRKQASKYFLEQLSGKGITGFVDRAGRAWEMGAYAEMVGRTTVAQAMLEGHADRIQELGVDTVMVSDSPEECSICRPFEGRVLSISGRTTGELTDGTQVLMSLSAAKNTGLYHPNCSHSHSIYLPGITKKPAGVKADPEGDALRKRQRAYERSIREQKRKTLIADEFGDSTAETAKLRAKQKDFKQWRDEHDRKTVPGRTSIKSR